MIRTHTRTATPGRVVATLTGAAALLLTAVVPVAAAADRGEQVEVLVVLADDTAPGAHGRAVARDHGMTVRHQYTHAVAGLAGTVPGGRLDQLRRDDRVAHVERDARVTTASVPTGVERSLALENPSLPMGAGDATAVGRVDATVAILDTGIDLDHPDLDVVHEWGCHTVSTGPPSRRSTTCDSAAGYGADDSGHGTHVAGTVAAFGSAQGIVGTAPGVELWSVKVLQDGGGSVSDLVAGIDHVTANADRIDVANMSLGGAFTSTTLDEAIAGSVAAGVTYVLAAGNDGVDVEGYSPAGHPDALTVAALADYDGAAGGGASPSCADHGADDTLATFSNHGDGVDLLAPGVCVRSSWWDGGTRTISGTSMAAPHVAGAAALLASADDTATPAQIHAHILAATNDGWDGATWPQGSAPGLLDLHDPDVFAPHLIEASTDDPVDDGTVVELQGGWSSARGSWTSWVDVQVAADGAADADRTATVVWDSDATTGEGACTTGGDGSCRVTGPTLPNRHTSVTYTVTHLDGQPIDPVELTVIRE